MTFGITPEETTVSNGAPATKACIRTISLWTLRWGLHSLTGKRMVPAIITKRQVRPRLVPAIPPLAHPRPPTSTVICVLKPLATISERTNTNGEMCHNITPFGEEFSSSDGVISLTVYENRESHLLSFSWNYIET